VEAFSAQRDAALTTPDAAPLNGERRRGTGSDSGGGRHVSPAGTTIPTAVDPLAEAPHAVWYVRPPTGGQFGPASADVMRRWIAEGRVTDDSWVWRDGWSDWKSASEMLREVRRPAVSTAAAKPTQATEMPAVVVDDDVSTIRTHGRGVGPRKSMAKTLFLVTLLGAISIALLGGLVHVILSSNS
jgi:hypothetical protein